jgi:hypothetical protein
VRWREELEEPLFVKRISFVSSRRVSREEKNRENREREKKSMTLLQSELTL